MSTSNISTQISALTASLNDPSVTGDFFSFSANFYSQIDETLLEDFFGNEYTEIKDYLAGFNLDESLLPEIDLNALLASEITYNDQTVSGLGAANKAVINTQAPVNSFFPDIFSGGTGSDVVLNVSGGSKILSGGMIGGVDGDDILVNIGSGTSALAGSKGNDYLFNIADGNNLLLGGEGNDTLLNIGSGSNDLRGEAGNDVIINYSAGTSILQGGTGEDTLVNLGDAATLQGGKNDDRLISWNGDDTLVGGQGDDTLIGGSGADLLTGGAGADVLTGGSGADTYVFTAQDWAQGDVITDFNASEGDKIQFDLDGAPLSFGFIFDSSSSQLYGVAGGWWGVVTAPLVTLEGVSNFDVSTIEVV